MACLDYSGRDVFFFWGGTRGTVVPGEFAGSIVEEFRGLVLSSSVRTLTYQKENLGFSTSLCDL